MIEDEFGNVPSAHVQSTPSRVVRAYGEYIKSLNTPIDTFFENMFPAEGQQSLVIIKSIHINSLCSHHLFPFFGVAHFGYIPNKHLLGLSKIPRFIEILAKRPTLQEKLTSDIVHNFNNYVEPLACGVVLDDIVHTCMTARGIEAHGTTTRTAALLGTFLTNSSVKQEFMDGIR
jgi:GTP cyclohydrolase IA